MVFDYLKNLIQLRGRRYIGHSPAGGAMVVALLVSLAITVGAGLFLDASRDRIGPFADLIGGPAPAVTRPADGGASVEEDREYGEHEYGEEDEEGHGEGGEDFLKEIHELFANLTLFLVILHIGGVALASYAHSENLPRAMVTGRKRPEK